ncbi:hypothetical protein AAGK95_26795 [Klebsiella pneumoniae]
MVDKVTEAAVVGGVDTHKDLHVAAVVDQNNKVLGGVSGNPRKFRHSALWNFLGGWSAA